MRIKRLILGAFVLTLLLAFSLGGGRLIAGEKKRPQAALPPVSEAALQCAAPLEPQAAEGKSEAPRRLGEAPRLAPAAGLRAAAPAGCGVDANGNTLTGLRFRQAVFLAFAPEEGFS